VTSTDLYDGAVQGSILDLDAPEVVASAIAAPRKGRHHKDANLPEVLAALDNLPRSGTQRYRVLEAFEQAGEQGLADFELEILLGSKFKMAGPGLIVADEFDRPVIEAPGMDRPTPGNRRGELEADQLVKVTDELRNTPKGVPAHVYRITDKGREVLAALRRNDL